jgi:DNA-3-methyladenine glycosylase
MTDRGAARPPSSGRTAGRTPPDDVGRGEPFSRAVLAGPTLDAAQALLGALLVRDATPTAERRVGRIVEVEAYIGVEDRASHARFGPTARNRVMFGPPGVAYVYLVYGMYHCLNVVTEPESRPAAVLIRAVEPLEGRSAMRTARLASRRSPAAAATSRAIADSRLASGPGLVAAAFEIDRTFTGTDLCDPGSELRLEGRPAGEPMPHIAASSRVGIAYAPEPWASVPWRFVVAGSASVSGPRA